MFDSLGEKIQTTFKKLTGRGKLTEKDIDTALREIRMALLEADVNYKVVKNFLTDVKARAMESEVFSSLTPGQTIVKIVYEAMSDLLGGSAKEINFSGQSPTVILLAGVQGSGKTTSAAKLALYLKRKNKLVSVAACDTQRAAAVDQLITLCKSISIDVFTEPDTPPETIAKDALSYARKNGSDVLIIDTAGRQHVDEELMAQISRITQSVTPHEVLFVVDCMMGQQAVDSALAFDETVKLTGFILSKADSDARGGAALSVSYITDKPIKFAGTGEKLNEFELFHPDRVSSRILGMGDVISLIEKAQETFDETASADLQRKLEKNKFTLQDYLDQLDSLSQMGGIEEILKSLPGGGGVRPEDIDPRAIGHTKAIIQSMTAKERNDPRIINASRRRRIARGSGTTVTDVNRLLNGFEQTKKLFKQINNSQKRKFGKLNFPIG
jgi:signal recognition particle subunit SRP54